MAQNATEQSLVLCIAEHQVGSSKTRQVKRLVHRGARHHASVGRHLSQVMHLHAGAQKVAVNLVRDDHHPVARADIRHANKLVHAPNATHGVVGIAQNHELGVVSPGQLLQAVKIHGVVQIAALILISVANKLVVEHVAPKLLNTVGKGRVDGALDNNAVTRFGKSLDRIPQRSDGARAIQHQIRVDGPLVTACKPIAHGVRIGRAAIDGAITKDAMVNRRVQRIQNGGRATKVHVGRKKGDMVIGNLAQAAVLSDLSKRAPFAGIAKRIMPAVNDLVKVDAVLLSHVAPF